MRRLVVPLCWFACFASTLAQVPPRPSTAVIAGRVVSATAPGEPVRRVTVTLSGATGNRPRAAVTDDAGRFAFPALPAGSYQLSAWKAAYLPTAYGVTRPAKPAPTTTTSTAGASSMTGHRIVNMLPRLR